MSVWGRRRASCARSQDELAGRPRVLEMAWGTASVELRHGTHEAQPRSEECRKPRAQRDHTHRRLRPRCSGEDGRANGPHGDPPLRVDPHANAGGRPLYTFYLKSTKPVLKDFASGGRSVADAFDVKEHLAFLALVMATGAFVLTRNRPKPTSLVRVLVSGAHGAVVLTAAIGLIVPSIKTP